MTDTTDLLLIPTVSRWLVYPQKIVQNIYPYAPSLSVENGSEFVIGSLLVNNEIIPIVDFDFDDKRQTVDSTEGFRITMVNTVFSDTKFNDYAVLAYGEPLSFTVKSNLIQRENIGDHRYIAQQVLINDERLANKVCCVPNLLSFEAELKMR